MTFQRFVPEWNGQLYSGTPAARWLLDLVGQLAGRYGPHAVALMPWDERPSADQQGIFYGPLANYGRSITMQGDGWCAALNDTGEPRLTVKDGEGPKWVAHWERALAATLTLRTNAPVPMHRVRSLLDHLAAGDSLVQLGYRNPLPPHLVLEARLLQVAMVQLRELAKRTRHLYGEKSQGVYRWADSDDGTVRVVRPRGRIILNSNPAAPRSPFRVQHEFAARFSLLVNGQGELALSSYPGSPSGDSVSLAQFRAALDLALEALELGAGDKGEVTKCYHRIISLAYMWMSSQPLAPFVRRSANAIAVVPPYPFPAVRLTDLDSGVILQAEYQDVGGEEFELTTDRARVVSASSEAGPTVNAAQLRRLVEVLGGAMAHW